MKQEDLKHHSLVRVVWVDSNFRSGWQPHDKKTADIPKIVSVGYVTHSDADVLELSGSIGAGDGDKLNPLSIPMCSVVEIEAVGALRDHK